MKAVWSACHCCVSRVTVGAESRPAAVVPQPLALAGFGVDP